MKTMKRSAIALLVAAAVAACGQTETKPEVSNSSAAVKAVGSDSPGIALQVAARDYFVAAYKGDDKAAREMMSAKCRDRTKGKPLPYKPPVDPASAGWKYVGGFGGGKPAEMTPYDSKGEAGPTLLFALEGGQWRMDSC